LQFGKLIFNINLALKSKKKCLSDMIIIDISKKTVVLQSQTLSLFLLQYGAVLGLVRVCVYGRPVSA